MSNISKIFGIELKTIGQMSKISPTGISRFIRSGVSPEPPYEPVIVDGLKLEPDTAPYTSTIMTTGVSALYDSNVLVAVSSSWFGSYCYGIDLGQSSIINGLKCYFINGAGLTPTSWLGDNWDSVSVYKADVNGSWSFVQTFNAPALSDTGSGRGAFTLAFSSPQTARYFKVVNIEAAVLAINPEGANINISEITLII